MCLAAVLILNILVVLVCIDGHIASAQVSCNHVITGTVTSDVVCSGDCVINGATITGSVDCSTGTLSTEGNAIINGNVLLSGGVTLVELDDVNILGDILVTSASSLTKLEIKQGASVGSVSVVDTTGDVIIGGQATDISLKDSGALFVNSLSTLSTISVQGGNGVIDICDSTLGGLSVSEHTGNIEINANSVTCNSPTTFTGSINACKGSGRIRVIGANFLSGDFIVTEYVGDVVLEQADVGDLTLSGNDGSLTITDTSTDSDVTITKQIGDAVLSSINVQGDFSVDLDGDLTLSNSDFNLEDVSLLKISGAVTVSGNENLNLLIEEATGAVDISNNDIVVGSVNKNTGGVDITDNTFESLSCADNSPGPTGSGNTVTFPSGQCASGLP